MRKASFACHHHRMQCLAMRCPSPPPTHASRIEGKGKRGGKGHTRCGKRHREEERWQGTRKRGGNGHLLVFDEVHKLCAHWQAPHSAVACIELLCL